MSDDETFGFIVTDSDGGYDEAKHTLIDDDAIDVVRTGNPSTPAAQPAAPMEAVTTGDLRCQLLSSLHLETAVAGTIAQAERAIAVRGFRTCNATWNRY